MSYSRPQLKLLLLLAAIFLAGLGVREWRMGFPDAAERQAFLRSPAYEQLNQLLRATIQRRGLLPRRSGGKRASTR